MPRIPVSLPPGEYRVLAIPPQFASREDRFVERVLREGQKVSLGPSEDKSIHVPAAGSSN
ncbi:MAG: hypothetical protein ABI995_00410 [Acidobacteriota bacterium]